MLVASVKLFEPTFALQSIPRKPDIILAEDGTFASVPSMNSGDGIIDSVNVGLLRRDPMDGS